MYALQRQLVCLNAIENALKQLRKKSYTDGLMDGLRSRFLSGSCILESSAYMLSDSDLTEPEAQLLDLIPDLSRLLMREEFGRFPRLSSASVAGRFLKSLYIGVPIEQFHALCLDDSGRLLHCELLQKGTVDETPFYLDRLLQAVIMSGASTVILSHNHPGGTPRPSRADLSCTISAISALHSIGILLLDHLIVANDKIISLRGSGYIDANLWLYQDSSSALLRAWSDEAD